MSSNKDARKYLDISEEHIYEFLKDAPIFSEVDDEKLKYVTSRSKSLLIGNGEILYKRNQIDRHVYFVYSGSLGEFVGNASDVNVIINIKRSAEFVGEMAALTNEPQATTIISNDRTILIEMQAEDFAMLMWNTSAMMQSTIFELIRRLRSASKYAVNSINLDAEGRLAYNICKLIPNDAKGKVRISLTQAELADATGITRQTAAKILAKWRDNGWLETVRGKLLINEQDKLMDVIVNSEMEI